MATNVTMQTRNNQTPFQDSYVKTTASQVLEEENRRFVTNNEKTRLTNIPSTIDGIKLNGQINISRLYVSSNPANQLTKNIVRFDNTNPLINIIEGSIIYVKLQNGHSLPSMLITLENGTPYSVKYFGSTSNISLSHISSNTIISLIFSDNSWSIIGGINYDESSIDKVDKNNDIIPGIATKITYDKKGLVTKGDILSQSDIPPLPLIKVTGLTEALASKGNLIDVENLKQQTSELYDTKLDKNQNISSATHTVIQYDEKGLVVDGSELTESHIPVLSISKIDNLQLSLDDKVNKNNNIPSGTYPKITYDEKGLVIKGDPLLADDIPLIEIDKIIDLSTKLDYITNNVDSNYNDLNDKIESKVNSNSLINANTKTKITYDEKGLVTNGDDLTIDDLPIIDVSNIDGLENQLSLKANNSKVDELTEYINDSLLSIDNALETKVNANSSIVGNTATKVTYDDKGLITSSGTLIESDIPNLSMSKILELNNTLNTKLDKRVTITGGTHTKITYANDGLILSGSELLSSDIPNIEISQVNNLATTLADLGNAEEINNELSDIRNVLSNKLDIPSQITPSIATKVEYDTNGLIIDSFPLDMGDMPSDLNSRIDYYDTTLNELNKEVILDMEIRNTTDNSNLQYTLTSNVLYGNDTNNTRTFTMPLASQDNAGIMPKESFVAIQDLSQKVASMNDGQARYTTNETTIPDESTGEGQSQFQSIYESVSGNTIPNDNDALVFIKAGNVVVRWFATESLWRVMGVDTLVTATLDTLGGIKSSTTPGQGFVESDSTLSLNGYDDIINNISNLTSSTRNASNITEGTLSVDRLPSTVVTTDTSQTITGTKVFTNGGITFNSPVIFKNNINANNVSVTPTEFGYIGNLTSDAQTQLTNIKNTADSALGNANQANINAANASFLTSGTVNAARLPNTVMLTDTSQTISAPKTYNSSSIYGGTATIQVSGVTFNADKLAYLTSVSSNIQDQLNLKANLNSPTFTGTPMVPTFSNGSNGGTVASTKFVHNIVGSRLATCDTASNIDNKGALLDGFVLVTGCIIGVKFTQANTNSAPFLNVNSTGVYAIVRYNNIDVGDTRISAGVHLFQFIGTKWVLLNPNISATDLYAVTTNTNQTITGNKTFNGNIIFGPSAGIQAGSQVFNAEKLAYLTSVSSNIQDQLNLKANLNSPTFTGIPTAPTTTMTANNTILVNAQFVQNLTSNCVYGTCGTASGTQAKIVTMRSAFTHITGKVFTVQFTNAVTTYPITLNIDGNGTRAVTFAGRTALSPAAIPANHFARFVFDGNAYVLLNPAYPSAADITGGTIPEGLLPSTVVTTNSTQTISGQKTITGNIIANGYVVSPTYLGHLNGVSSNIQTQLNNKAGRNESPNFVGNGGVSFAGIVYSLQTRTGWSVTVVNNTYNGIYMNNNGNTNPLIYNIPTTSSGETYRINITITSATTPTTSLRMILSATAGSTSGMIVENHMMNGMNYLIVQPNGAYPYLNVFPQSGFIGTFQITSISKSSAVNRIHAYFNSTAVRGDAYSIYIGSGGQYVNASLQNVSLGYNSMNSILTGSNNVAIGVSSLKNLTSAATNVAIGTNCLLSTINGNTNIGIGLSAAFNNRSGAYNIALGNAPLYHNISGNYNISLGSQSMYNGTQGDNNVAIGGYTLYANNGSANIAIGYAASQQNTSGSNNIAIGNSALFTNTTNSFNVALGHEAMTAATGSENIGIGRAALRASTANRNIGIGYTAAYNTTAGSAIIAIGEGALYNNKVGSYCTAVGTFALNLNTASHNTAYGYAASNDNTNGTQNVAVGSNALRYMQTGNANVAIGYNAGSLTNAGAVCNAGNNNIFIGTNSRSAASGNSNQIVIGTDTQGKGTNTISMGNGNTTGFFVNVTAFSAYSDRRVKEDISLANPTLCLQNVLNLPLSRFKYKDFTGNHLDKHILGFMSDDVRKIFPKSVQVRDQYFPILDDDGNKVYEEKINEDGITEKIEKTFLMKDVEDVTMSEAVPTLWGAIQELYKIIDNLKSKINKLESNI